MEEEIELIEGEHGHSKGAADVDEAEKHGKDVVEDVDDSDSWLKSMKERLDSNYRKPSQFSICRVPSDIRKSDKDAYNPSIVSIGPFHRGSPNLQAMENLKWRYLHIHSNAGSDLEKYFEVMKEIEPEIRTSYSGNIDLDVNEFIEMMLLDGFFIIQLLLQQRDIKYDDPIYNVRGMLHRIGHDMLLLENQLPVLVLECLWNLIGQRSDTFWPKVLAFLNLLNLPFEFNLDFPSPLAVDHFLHLVYLLIRPTSSDKKSQTLNGLRPRCYCFSSSRGQQSSQESRNKAPPPREVIPSATELQEAGVKFQCVHARSFLDVTFEHGKLKLPRLRVDDFTNSLFRNFIAYEQCFPFRGSHFTAYCSFIDSLVNTPSDVGILNQSEIINNELGSDKEVALLFNNLCKGIFWDPSADYLANVSQKVIQHTRKRWSRWRAKLVHDYFSSPWTILSLIAAIAYLCFTFVQAFFPVWTYFKPRKP